MFIDLDESDALCVCFVCVRSGWDDGSSFRDKWIIHFRGRTSKRNLEWRGMRFQLLMTVWVLQVRMVMMVMTDATRVGMDRGSRGSKAVDVERVKHSELATPEVKDASRARIPTGKTKYTPFPKRKGTRAWAIAESLLLIHGAEDEVLDPASGHRVGADAQVYYMLCFYRASQYIRTS